MSAFFYVRYCFLHILREQDHPRTPTCFNQKYKTHELPKKVFCPCPSFSQFKKEIIYNAQILLTHKSPHELPRKVFCPCPSFSQFKKEIIYNVQIHLIHKSPQPLLFHLHTCDNPKRSTVFRCVRHHYRSLTSLPTVQNEDWLTDSGMFKIKLSRLLKLFAQPLLVGHFDK
jgi:hypothetical protein